MSTTIVLATIPVLLAISACDRRFLVAAFLAYTPLIRWELALRLIVFAYRMGKQDGARRREAEYVVRSAEKVRSDARHYNVSLRYA